MDLIAGMVFMSLQYVKVLLPVCFFGSILYHFFIYREFKIVLTKGITFLIAVAMVVGMPLGIIKLTYPEANTFEKWVAKEEVKP